MSVPGINVDKIFDDADTSIRNDVIRMIIEHLNKEKLFMAANVLEDEINTKLMGLNAKRVRMAKFHKAVLHGDWDVCFKTLAGIVPKFRQKHFLYHILRQQYLELIDAGENEAAFSFLTEHLKPLEHIAASQGSTKTEFKELCYLLTCKSVAEGNSDFFRSWTHYAVAREHLADHLVHTLFSFLREESGIYDLCPPQMLSSDVLYPGARGGSSGSGERPENDKSRLVQLLKQSYAFQVNQRTGAAVREALSTSVLTKEDMENDALSAEENISSADSPFESSRDSVSLEISPFISSSAPLPNSISVLQTPQGDLQEILPPSVLPYSHTQPTAHPAVRRLIDDFYDQRIPHRLVGVLTPFNTDGAGSGDRSPDSMYVLACMAFVNGERGDSVKGTAIGGTDRGTLLEYNYDALIPTKECSNRKRSDPSSTHLEQPRFISPSRVISLSGISSTDLLVEDYGARSRTPRAPIRNGTGKSYHPSAAAAKSHSQKKTTNVKIRDMSIDANATTICVGASDGTLNLLKRGLSKSEDMKAASYTLLARSKVHEGDCYSTFMQPSGDYHISGGFDHNVAVYDVSASSVVKMFSGHIAPVMSVGCNRPGNLVYSASKDGTVKFWDLLSGGCVKTLAIGSMASASSSFRANLTPSRKLDITSASLSADGLNLLVSARFCPTRCIDLRTDKVIIRYLDRNRMAGSTNSFYTSSFCGNDMGVVAGSGHGTVTVWSTKTGNILQSLQIPSSSVLQAHQDIRNAEVIRCRNDRFSNTVGAVTPVGIALWGSN